MTILLGMGEIRGLTVNEYASQRHESTSTLSPSLVYVMFYCYISWEDNGGGDVNTTQVVASTAKVRAEESKREC
jgi:hypothetical protein